MTHWFRLLLAVAVVSFAAACGGGGDGDAPPPAAAGPLTTLQTLQADARFSTLVQALESAGLADRLNGAEVLTLFAPTNDGFDALLQQLDISREQLLADVALLTEVLSYHVVPGLLGSAAMNVGKTVTPLRGGVFKAEAGAVVPLRIVDGRNRSSVALEVDLATTNGAIHVLTDVLLPGNRTILEQLAPERAFSILVEALAAANLQDKLGGSEPLTLIAPNNFAFEALFQELGLTKEQFLADQALLAAVLGYHMVDGLLLQADLPANAADLDTAQGTTFRLSNIRSLNRAFITDQRNRESQVIDFDFMASNGVVHTADGVLLPAP